MLIHLACVIDGSQIIYISLFLKQEVGMKVILAIRAGNLEDGVMILGQPHFKLLFISL